ncbi:hypothetical protein ABVQ18_01190 [Snodgrassella alvi]|uniref:hypothetical protein n=1 Tax=Snodgrassella alvi TaxID=1196083 RepID=UPI00345F8344
MDINNETIIHHYFLSLITFIQQAKTVLKQLAQAQHDEAWVLAEQVSERKLEKNDVYLPDNLLSMGYANQAVDTTATHQWLQQLIPTLPETDQT